MRSDVSRRGILRGALSLLAAPAIVRASSLMAVKPLPANPFALQRSEMWYRMREMIDLRELYQQQWQEIADLIIYPPIVPTPSVVELREKQLDAAIRLQQRIDGIEADMRLLARLARHDGRATA